MAVAESRGAARDAAELVQVEYEELPAVVDVEQAAKGLPVVIDPNFPNNIGFTWDLGTPTDAVNEAMSRADVVVEEKFVHQRLGANPMEPRTVLAEWREGELW